MTFLWAGRLAMVLALLLLCLESYKSWPGISSWRPDAADLFVLTGCAAGYACALFLLAEAWHRIVRAFGTPERAVSYKAYMRSSVAKYLPGNVAHLIGRGFLMRGNTLKDGDIVKSTFVELIITPAGALLTLAVLFLVAGQSTFAPWFGNYSEGMAVGGLFVCSAAAIVLALGRIANRPNARLQLSWAVFLSALFMAVLGLIFIAIYSLLSSDIPRAELFEASIVSWLLGFVTPGAPGGLGVREASLSILLQDHGADATVLISAALLRLVTIAGDLIFFSTSWLIFPHRPARETKKGGRSRLG
ncbi:hypothetical protein E1178_18435 [Roseibium hamelinense]|uniref:lysylphosphatidylglycerol synthase domain-containing protein n=1 Tax=Roseibium hamelinense TaxID=150831 RepID=UPI00119D1D3B|nr:lysylphosphatidylglycerol synthase domain-containing protein [Roseibium hamelinense]MTI45586.1 hypothetical protein [Roseibium hamelinense]